MTGLELTHLVAELVIFLGVMYLALLKSYFQEKGKNLATKEDVEEITEKVESIKASLQFSVQAKLSWRACEHDALVNYYVTLSTWVSAIANFSLVGVNEESADRLGELRAALDTVEREAEAAEAKLHLFVNNEGILAQAGTIRLRTLDFQHHAQSFAYQYELAILESKSDKLGKAIEQQLEIHSANLDRRAKLYREFKDGQTEQFRGLWPLIKGQRDAISAHLRTLSTE